MNEFGCSIFRSHDACHNFILPLLASEVETTTVTTAETGNFAQDLLNAQNQYRARHGVPRMTLSKKLVSDAQK